MKIVWNRGSATVREVYEELLKQRKIAYTTVMTMMGILEQKGYLKKEARDRAHLYRPALPQQQVVGAMLRDFVDRVFDGASDSLLLHLAKDNTLTAKQKKLLTKLLDEQEKD